MPEKFGATPEASLHGSRVEDYALIGDLETAALVSRSGSIDWLCWPNFSSGACFASLLGTAQNGFWRIAPLDEIRECRRRYRQDTLILETAMETAEGEVLLTDFMPPRGKHSDVIRFVQGVRGEVRVRLDLVIRFDYGLTVPWVTMHEQELRAVAGPNLVVLRSLCKGGEVSCFRGEGLTTFSEFTVRKGDLTCFTLTYGASNEDSPPPVDPDEELRNTESFWKEWAARSQYSGPYTEIVKRSLLTLKALTYQPTGGIVASPTTSLPEEIGGERNWDYRYCWLRDAAFTLLVLIRAGYTEEAIEWRLWLLRAIAGAPDQVQSLYGLNGERKLIEWTTGWLPGYERSQPVRIGNAASEQFQLDVYGEVGAALSRTPAAADDLRTPSADLQAALIDHLCEIWHLPDEGIWETRGGRKHFVHSKMMAWVALDRAVKHYEQFDGAGNVGKWKENRDKLHEEICTQGFSQRLNSFTQSYGSETLDASCLRMIIGGFLPPDDPRMIGTVEAVQKYLMRDGLVQRYNTLETCDGLAGGEGTFLACSFWMVICLHLMGGVDESRSMFERLIGLCNDVGLLSEEYGTGAKRMLGNFPQALSHLALVHAAFTLSSQWRPEPMERAG